MRTRPARVDPRGALGSCYDKFDLARPIRFQEFRFLASPEERLRLHGLEARRAAVCKAQAQANLAHNVRRGV